MIVTLDRCRGQTLDSDSDSDSVIDCSGIPTKAGIQAKWNRDLADNTVRKVQVDKLDETGLPSGSMTWCIYVPVKWEAKDIRYKD